MARVNLRGRGSTGVVAIWTGEDDAPYFNPLNHLANGRVKFHSSLDYPKVVREETLTLNLGARTTIGSHRVSYDLFAHGRPGIPWVLGSMNIGGANVAAVGSVPVQKAPGSGSAAPWARWISIGANATHVTAFEYCVVVRAAPNYQFSAASVPITIWVTDELF